MNILLTLALLSQALTNLQATLQTPIVEAATPSYTAWKQELRQCESGGNDNALNPKDSDGTPSKGRFQFKDKTFAHFSQKYDVQTTSVWNGDEQELLLDRMILDPEVSMRNQFPACTRKIGLPVTSM